jgi:enterochelin esterase-like enzyme
MRFLTLAFFALSAAAQPAGLVSPEIMPDQSVVFRLRAGKATDVAVRGQWDRQAHPMTHETGGEWIFTAAKVPAGVWEYSFIVDGVTMIDPLNSALKPQRNPSASILHVAAAPPSPWDFQDVAHGTVHRHDFAGKAAGRPREVWVYTPAGYEADTGKKYPLLVLQHGSGDNQKTWVEHGKAHWILDSLIAAGKAQPMIVMMLDGHPLGQIPREATDRRGASLKAFKDELLLEAMPLVESLYRVLAGPAHHAITGLSMGGWQSLSTGLTNLDKFAWVGSFSGAVDENEIKSALDDGVGTNARLKLLWIACGKDDFLLDRNNQLIATLKKQSITHAWLLSDGDHSWPVWRGYLADFLPKLFR